MDHQFDEFSKSLAEALPRRETLRRLGVALAGVVLSPLGVQAGWGRRQDPCQAFCKCRNSKQQNQCLAACRACGENTTRLGGACGSYVCCATASCNGVCSNLKSDPNCGACGNNCGARSQTCCGSYCADLRSDPNNCGGCGRVCAAPGPLQSAACVSGQCVYSCVAGTANCNGTCTNLNNDQNNCGACGNVCGGSTPYCSQGKCTDVVCPGGGTYCNGVCTNISFDPVNCGACGVVCAGGETCSGGVCQSPF